MGNILGKINFICNDGRNKERLNNIEEDIKQIKENHLLHMRVDIAEIKTDIKIIKDGIQNIRFNIIQ